MCARLARSSVRERADAPDAPLGARKRDAHARSDATRRRAFARAPVFDAFPWRTVCARFDRFSTACSSSACERRRRPRVGSYSPSPRARTRCEGDASGTADGAGASARAAFGRSMDARPRMGNARASGVDAKAVVTFSRVDVERGASDGLTRDARADARGRGGGRGTGTSDDERRRRARRCVNDARCDARDGCL